VEAHDRRVLCKVRALGLRPCRRQWALTLRNTLLPGPPPLQNTSNPQEMNFGEVSKSRQVVDEAVLASMVVIDFSSSVAFRELRSGDARSMMIIFGLVGLLGLGFKGQAGGEFWGV
jgi:hypothetical protein